MSEKRSSRGGLDKIGSTPEIPKSQRAVVPEIETPEVDPSKVGKYCLPKLGAHITI